MKTAHDELIAGANENASLKQQISELKTKSKSPPPPPPNDQHFKLKALEKQLEEEKNKYSELEKEQEDLLVCMGKYIRFFFFKKWGVGKTNDNYRRTRS